MFNPNVDKIAVCIPKIKLKKNSDFSLEKYNEPYIIALTIDANNSNSPAINFSYHPFPKVSVGDNLPLFGEGFLVYPPKNPGDFLVTSILVMESDKSIQQTGETIEQIITSTIKEQNFTNTILSILSTATTLPYKEILNALTILADCIAKFLKNNKDDELLRCEGTFLKNTNPPYYLGKTLPPISNNYIELSINVISLVDSTSITSPKEIIHTCIDCSSTDFSLYEMDNCNFNDKNNTYIKAIDLKSIETSWNIFDINFQ